MINNVKMSIMRYDRCNRIYYMAFGRYKSRQMFTHHIVVMHKIGLIPWHHRRFMKKWKHIEKIWKGNQDVQANCSL